jgi:hypothetical protein
MGNIRYLICEQAKDPSKKLKKKFLCAHISTTNLLE